HDPVVDFKHVLGVLSGAKNHGADETIITDTIQEAELEGQDVGQVGKMFYLFTIVSPACYVELIGFVEQLDNAGVSNGGERAVLNRNLKPKKEIVHTLRGSERGLAYGICGVELGAGPILGCKAHGFEVTGIG